MPAAACAGEVFDGPWTNPPKLPEPEGKVVRVENEAELQRAVANLQSGTTILLAKGEYRLTNTVHLRGGHKNIALRGETGKREDVVLIGRGMRNKDYGNVPHGIMVSDCTDVLIAILPLRSANAPCRHGVTALRCFWPGRCLALWRHARWP